MKKNDSKGRRGTALRPKNRFETRTYVPDLDFVEEQTPLPGTQFIEDQSKSIITRNDSPDIGYDASLNPYRGCEHGCVYCYARPTHEYLGFNCGIDFESKIIVKKRAPELLRAELSKPDYTAEVLALSGVTDPYQPVERQLGLTRKCLEVLVEFRHPVCIVTKNSLVLRDIDLLSELAQYNAVRVSISISTLDNELRKYLEPRTSPPLSRLETISKLAQARIPVSVLVSPVIPALTDHEIPMILKNAAEAGALCAYYSVLRLPYCVADLFIDWLDKHYPEKKEKIISRLKSMHGGKIYDPQFFRRLRGSGFWADQIERLFEVGCKKYKLNQCPPELSTAHFKKLGQMNLF